MKSIADNLGYLYTFPRKQGKDSSDPFTVSDKDIIRTFIADDHPYLIHGVENDLNKDKRIKIIGTAGSYSEVLSKLQHAKPDIILLDLRMPGHDAYDLRQYISEIKAITSCKIVIFSNETGWARIHRCLEVGASAYIEKAIAIGRLAEFIHRVHEKDELLIFTAEQLPLIQFSKRQKEILHLIVEGKENDQIATCLEIELKTVQSYVNEIKEKLAQAFEIHPIRPRTLLLLATKLGFGRKIISSPNINSLL